MNIESWTPLYLDYITHYGQLKDFRRSSVTITGKVSPVYTLSKWYKGCGFVLVPRQYAILQWKRLRKPVKSGFIRVCK